MARGRRSGIVAEGVRTAAQLIRLQASGFRLQATTLDGWMKEDGAIVRRMGECANEGRARGAQGEAQGESRRSAGWWQEGAPAERPLT